MDGEGQMAGGTVTALNWMAGVQDDTRICDLSIPGSHESCAVSGYGLSQCQWLTIAEQLDRGIRFFDIRCVDAEGLPVLPDDDFWIYHGGYYEGMTFSAVQAQCIQFLIDNPTETIFMNVQRTAPGQLKNRGPTEFMEQFVRAINRDSTYRAHWSCPHWWSDRDMWTLERCRTQIVLIRAWGSDGWPGDALPGGTGLDWLGYEIDGNSHDAHFQTQNGWTIPSDADKVAAVKQYLDLAADGSIGADKIYINFLSRAAGGYVGTAAQAINDDVQQYLASGMSNTTGRLGVLPIDFVGNTGWEGCLEDLIIRRNPFQAGYNFTYTISPFKLQLSVEGDPQKRWLATDSDGWALAAADPGADALILSRAQIGGGDRDAHDVFKAEGTDQYLSVSSAGQVGLYSESGATTFYEQVHGLISKWNGKPLRMRPSGELWCGDQGERVEIAYVPA